MNQEKVNDFASLIYSQLVETLHDVDLDKDNIREFFTAIPFATCKLMNKFATEKKDVIHHTYDLNELVITYLMEGKNED